VADEKALDRAETEDETLRAERLAHFLNGRVPVGAERRHDGLMAGFDAFRATVAAQRLRPRVALFSLASAPTAHARCADTEPVATSRWLAPA
jgi:hypothetical protein